MSRTRRFGRLRRAATRRRRPQPREAAAFPRLTLLLLSLPGIAAVAALLFTWLQVGQAGKELRIAEKGQITTRFNTAIGNLGSQSMDVRLGGIYALERIMKDSAEDQPSVVSVLTAYVRRHAPVPATAAAPPADVHAAMNVLVRRRPDRDGGAGLDLSRTALPHWKPTQAAQARVIHLADAIMTGSDLSAADLAVADMPRAGLEGANLTDSVVSGANLTEARFNGANLRRADFDSAVLSKADFSGTDLRGTKFDGANMKGALLCGVTPCAKNLDGTTFSMADLTGAFMSQLDLRKAEFCDRNMIVLVEGMSPEEKQREVCAVLRGTALGFAHLSAVDLRGADLRGALLPWADLQGADLREADLSGADLTGADLTGAKLTGARMTHAVLTDTKGLPTS
ncbi:pentapeptide repeat-containing protein [Streptomyces sp. NPDC057131]|uniref:pentapeptide repeat-containing protein n=1 Tax=unclassified Streptomyces TaxID=2593676 RepID=UPI00362DDEF7